MAYKDNNGYLIVKNESGSEIFSRSIGSDGVVLGYTATTVSYKANGYIYLIDDRGSEISSVSC